MIWLALRIREPGSPFSEAERRWLDRPFAKVCVRLDSEEEPLGVVRAAQEAGVDGPPLPSSMASHSRPGPFSPSYSCNPGAPRLTKTPAAVRPRERRRAGEWEQTGSASRA